MNFTVGNKEYVFQPYEGSDACNRCVFHKKPHSCKASDLFDSGVLPQCDEDGIGRGYFTKSSDTEHSYLGNVVKLGDYIIISGETYSVVGLSSWGVQLLRCSYDGDTNRLTKSWQELEMSKPVVKRTVVVSASKPEVDGNTSDGYHTFNELYHHRAVLFSVICKCFKNNCWKSKQHHDGTMYDGMFIVGINTPDGQATYHYDIDPYWDMFDVKELDRAPEWDGHTPDQAIERIGKLREEAFND
jgi:hypothetical protein